MTETLTSSLSVATMLKRVKWFAEFATFQWDEEMRRGFEAEADYWAAQAKSAAVWSAESTEFALAA